MAANRVFLELAWFVYPLRLALSPGGAPDGNNSQGENLALFLAQFGIELDPDDWAAALAQIGDLPQTIDAALDLVAQGYDAAGDFKLTEQEKAELALAAKNIADRVDKIGDVASSVAGANIGLDFPLEVLDRLIDLYLAHRLPPLLAVLQAVDARQLRTVVAGDPDGRDLDYVEIRYRWFRVGQFLTDNAQWADEVYGWSRDFDSPAAILALADIVSAFGGRTRYEGLDRSMVDAFVSNVPMPAIAPPGADPRDTISIARLPVFVARSDDGIGNITASGEAGFSVLPFGDFAQPQNLGLALAPYVEGTVHAETEITDRLTFKLEHDAAATGGVYFALQPSGLTVGQGGNAGAEVSGSLIFRNADDSPILLLGEPDSTRVEIGSATFSLGANTGGDIFFAGAVEDLRLVIEAPEDGLLGTVFTGPAAAEVGDVVAGYRPGRGVYFESGTALGVTFPVDIDLNFLRIMSLSLELDWETNFTVTLAAEGELEIGPLYAYADGIGVRAEIVERNGLLGRHDLDFSFVAPSAYAIELEIPGVTGGGLIAIEEDEYRGALALQFQKFGFSAFGILNTTLPNGQDGYSFAASIFGEMNVPLPFGFVLTGIGGMIGINRTVDTDALRDVLYSGSFDNLLFPADPIENAASILDDLANILPASEGQHVFGPVARIGWGKPTLINIKLGVMIEVGQNEKIVILGGVESYLPTRDAAIVQLELAFFGEIDFGARTIAFDATLQNSRILTFTISGDAALRSGWAPQIEHVVSFGGLHPKFPKPANLPELRRMSIAFGTNNPRVSISGYCALTLNTLQFGAHADAYMKGPKIPIIGQLAAEGWLYFDALISFNPFGFTVSLAGGVDLLRNGDTVCGMGFDLTFSGPNRFIINGKAWVTVFRKDIKIPINKEWGSAQTLPPIQTEADVVLQEALAKAIIEPLATSERRRLGVSYRRRDDGEAMAIDPFGGIVIDQSAVPLGVRLDKVGDAVISGPRAIDFELAYTDGTPLADPASQSSDFVRSQFFNRTETERLRGAAFDNLKSGYAVADASLVSDAGNAIDDIYEYERIVIPAEDDGHLGPVGVLDKYQFPGSLLTDMQWATAVDFGEYDSRQHTFAPADAVHPIDPGYVVQPDIEDVINTAGTVGTAGGPQGAGAATIYGSMREAEMDQAVAAGGASIANDNGVLPDGGVTLEREPVVPDYFVDAVRELAG